MTSSPQISWQPNWVELDLVFGMATSSDGAQSLLDPLTLATLPRSGVQLADVSVEGSEGSDRVFSGIGSRVNTAGGSDELFNDNSQGGNLLMGGPGNDAFFLAAVDDTVIGGSLIENPNQPGLRPYLALPDGESDSFTLLSDGFTPNNSLTILDFEPGLDRILIDGVDATAAWPELKQSLANQGFLINAIPSLQSAWSSSPLSIRAGGRLEVSASAIGSDPDGDALTLRVLEAPSWITSNGDTLLIAAPQDLVQADVNTPIRLALSDGSAFVPFNLELIVDTPPTPVTPTPGGTIQTVDSDNDGLREVEIARDGKAIDGNNDGVPDAQQANVAGFRLVNDGGSSADFGALEVAAGVKLQFKGDPLVTTNDDGAFSFTGRGGFAISAALPSGLSNSLAGVIAFEVTDLEQGSSTDVILHLPRAVSLTEPNQSAYIKYNYASGRFEEFVDAAGDPLYNLVDRNGDGILDGIQLKLVDGDPQWDGDGLANGTVIDPGTLVSAERYIDGGSKRDYLIGNALANTLRGHKGRDHLIGDLGNDVLIGGIGNDRLDGGEGADLIIGGRGRDYFIYNSAADSTMSQSDTIRKITSKDRFDLRGFETNTMFEFIGNNEFSGTAGELRTTLTSLQADLDGDGSADFRVNFTNKFRLEADQILF